MEDRRKHRTPQESADFLAGALTENTKALNKVRKRVRWVLYYVIAATLVVAIGFKNNYDGNVSRCVAGNELRVELDEKWQRLADILVAAGSGSTPEGQEVINILADDLDPRDCTNISWLGG